MFVGKLSLFGKSNDAIMNYLLELLKDNFAEYEVYEKTFFENVDILRPYLTDKEDYTDDLIALEKLKVVTVVKNEVISGLMFNLDYFKNPQNSDFVKSKHMICPCSENNDLQERYNYANERIKEILDKLDGKGYILYQNFKKYFEYVEYTGKILAHYLGYLLGNDFLHYFVPDYVCNLSHTERYNKYIEEKLGVRIMIR